MLCQFQISEEAKSIELTKKEMQKIEQDAEKAEKTITQYIMKGFTMTVNQEKATEVSKLHIEQQIIEYAKCMAEMKEFEVYQEMT